MDKKIPQINTNLKRQKLIALISGVILIALIIVLIVVFRQPITQIISNPDRARDLVMGAGPFGPLVFIVFQIAQIVIAPIPGNFVGFAGGYLFGWLPGLIYSLIGTAVGVTIVFFLSRKLGRPFVEYFFDKKHLKKFDYLSQNNGLLILFLISLIPIFPDDIVCYLAGLTSMPIRNMVIVTLLGRFPSSLLVSLTGDGLAESNIKLVVAVAAVIVVALALVYWQRARLENWTKRFTQKND